jgi:predicted RNA-binding protein YlxR (DUF448 family)
MTPPKHVPQRSCVACRTARGKWELVRVVRTPLGAVQVDPTGKLAGRGAYLCRNEACLAQAVKQKKLNRALGVAVEAGLAEELRQQLSGSQGVQARDRRGER